MNELALFAGAGGGILGGHLLGWRTVCAVEWEPYPASVLCARQNDALLPPFPIWDDVCTFDGKPWAGIVDVVSGGFPCQDISSAGGGAGITGSRSGLWKEMARIIGEVRPQYAFIENSPMLTIRGLDTVLCDLASMGFNANWGVISAADVGAPHLRKRIWIVAHSESNRNKREPRHFRSSDGRQNRQMRGESFSASKEPKNMAYSNSNSQSTQPVNAETICKPDMAHTNSTQRQGNKRAKREQPTHSNTCGAGWWEIEPNVGRVANGVAARVDRLKAIGNGQVPAVAATAFRLLSEDL